MQNKVESKKSGNALLIGYLYFVQGVVLSLPAIIPLTYSKIPDYSVLSIFAAGYLPFSFKFLTAPLVQTYTSLNYGRRKTWIVLSCFLLSIMIFGLSFFADQKYVIEVAIACFFLVFVTSVQDISTDALGIKQLNNPGQLSYLQALMQQVGNIFGSLVFMKMISKQFGQSLGFDDALISIQNYLRIICLIILVPGLYIHFNYVEQTLQQQKIVATKSILEIYKEYKIFFNLKNRFCRQALTFILYLQGLSFYNSSYKIQLMNAGFSKQTLTTIDNFTLFPLMISTFYLSKLDKQQNRVSHSKLILIARFLLQIIGFYLIDLTQVYTLGFYMLISDIVMLFGYIIDCNTINSNSGGALAGMYVTMLNSSRNLGTNSTIQLKITDYIGFNKAIYIGFIYQIIIIVFFNRIQQWIKRGQQKKLQNKQD